MGGFSVDGLVSGLDTSTIVSQLIAVERNPQVRLQQRQSEIRETVDAFKTLNTKLSTVRDSADDLSSTLDWRDKTVLSSDESIVSAAVTSAAAKGVMAFTVDQLASTHTVISANSTGSLDDVIADGSDFTVNGVTITAAEYGGGTLSEVVAAIGGADAGVSAAAVQVSPGEYRLQLTAQESGEDAVFTVGGTGLNAAMGTFGIVSQGEDATITIGNGPSAYEVTSSTNTFTDVLPGLTFTANGVGSVNLQIDSDAEALADKVESLVTAMNDASAYIRERSSYDSETRTAGVFLGESMATRITSDLSRALISQVSGSSLVGSSVGIETDREGVISFDREKFIEAYASDADAVEALFSTGDAAVTTDDGLAERLSLAAESATKSSTGRIALAIEGRESEIDILQERIDNWDLRLEQREAALRRQFANLETLLSRQQQQGQWLAGQLASLPGPRTA